MSNDYKEFLKDENRLNSKLQQKIFSHIERKINPSLKGLLPKFAISLSAAGLATLSVCPQFGVGPFIGEHGLGHVFMAYGETLCAAFCGAFFLSVSTVIALTTLKSYERKVIFEYEYRVLSSASVLIFMLFMLLNKVFALPSLYDSNLASLAWVTSGLAAAILVSKVTKRLISPT
tara:strand:+ start:1429 stop:1953 length:525 start_codon:yes stop_codon:yes gene_type:complete